MIKITIEVDDEMFTAEADTVIPTDTLDGGYNQAQREHLKKMVAMYITSLEKRAAYNREG